MARKKLPAIDVNELIISQTQELLKNTHERIQWVADNLRQNYQVLLALAAAGLIKREYINASTIQYGTSFSFPQSKLTKVRLALGTIKDNGEKSLVNEKRRLIKVGLKMEDFPKSDIYISYIRKYTKQDEENSPCKIKKVEVAPAQPAREAQYAYKLICTTPTPQS